MDLLQICKGYFASIGVDMEIRTMDYTSWKAFVSINYKHDQITAVSTGASLGKTTEPMIQISRFISWGTNQWSMVNDPNYDALYNKAVAATSVAEVKQILKDTNERIARQHYDVCLLQPMLYDLVQPWLFGYNGQVQAIYGATGPSLLFEYPARFWIDQQLKDSMTR
jgi:ABC-type transport system substrate-binding protein